MLEEAILPLISSFYSVYDKALVSGMEWDGI